MCFDGCTPNNLSGFPQLLKVPINAPIKIQNNQIFYIEVAHRYYWLFSLHKIYINQETT
jgi:hypothetical protein